MTHFSINCKGSVLNLDKPQIMGILNYTPDSFSDGACFNEPSKALRQIEKMISEGAKIVDIGAVSSRPGAQLPSLEEEKQRLKPILRELHRHFPKQIFSLDTFRSEIAEWAVEAYGIDIINDISAGELDPKMYAAVARLQVPYIIMHMKGQPENMQKQADYKDIIQELLLYFATKVKELKAYGIHDIVIDPGFGFGKTLNHNYKILEHLEDFKVLEHPLLVGVSRKSMIQRLLNTSPKESINGSTVIHTLSLCKGAKILRVHDVKEAKQCISLLDKSGVF